MTTQYRINDLRFMGSGVHAQELHPSGQWLTLDTFQTKDEAYAFIGQLVTQTVQAEADEITYQEDHRTEDARQNFINPQGETEYTTSFGVYENEDPDAPADAKIWAYDIMDAYNKYLRYKGIDSVDAYCVMVYDYHTDTYEWV